MSPQYYAESGRGGECDQRRQLGMYREAADAATVARTQNSALILIMSSRFWFPATSCSYAGVGITPDNVLE